MNRPFIEFKKQRDFGLLLSDTFTFIRNEFKPFMHAIFTISGPTLVLFVFSVALYMYAIGDLFDFNAFITNDTSFNNPLLVIIAVIVYLFSLLLAYVFITSSSLNYIKSYIKNNGAANFSEVKQNVHKTLWSCLGLGFLKWISIGFAILLCFLPVLYMMVPMFLVFSIYIFENNRSATDSYSYSFYLVNEDFWLSIGTIIVLGILITVIGQVFSIPALIYTYAKMGIFSGEIDPANMDLFKDPFYIFLNVLNNLFKLLLYIIYSVTSAFIYFHLNEKKNFTGTYERISNIGQIEE